MKAIAKAPASIGELIQGKIYGNEMLVSCPIDRYSIAKVEIVKNHGVDVYYEKVYKAFQIFLNDYTKQALNASDISVKINSDIPRGKGMASSTADISSALAALSHLLSYPITEKEIASIAIKIEPTDSSIFSSFTLFDHLYGKYIETIAPIFQMEFLLLEGKGTIDTISFRDHKDYKNLLYDMEESYEQLKWGIIKRDIQMIARICTESSFNNQRILFKPYLEKLLNIVMDSKGLGVNVAHSGSVCGVLIGRNTDKNRLVSLIQKNFASCFKKMYFTRTVKGGIVSKGLLTYDNNMI